MKKINKLDVIYNSRKVGTLALYKERLAAFEYDKDWLADGFSISPLSLPLDQKVFIPKSEPFDGIFGVFADSLPDGWGRLLVDRLMCFNVFAHNRDDHSKNFSYLYDEASKCWKLSPAYDLTYSYSIGGEHATTVHGNGSDPRLSDILEVAKTAGIDHNKAAKTAADIQECVHTLLKQYL
jgi:HipA-like protein